MKGNINKQINKHKRVYLGLEHKPWYEFLMKNRASQVTVSVEYLFRWNTLSRLWPIITLAFRIRCYRYETLEFSLVKCIENFRRHLTCLFRMLKMLSIRLKWTILSFKWFLNEIEKTVNDINSLSLKCCLWVAPEILTPAIFVHSPLAAGFLEKHVQRNPVTVSVFAQYKEDIR